MGQLGKLLYLAWFPLTVKHLYYTSTSDPSKFATT